MNKLQLEAKLSQLKKLSTVPEMMAQILDACKDPELSVRRLAGLVQRDPALTSRILKVSNSPYYGQSQRVVSIGQAVSLLGVNRIKALALSLSLYDLTAKIGSHVDHREFWRHSLNVACTAELLARQVSLDLAEEAFVCGCLHDIGILALDQVCPDKYAEVCRAAAEHGDIVSAERAVLDTDHAAVGELLARMWNFPPEYCDAIGAHHDLFDDGSDRPRLVAIVHLADKLATFTVEGQIAGREESIATRAALGDSLGLNNTALKKIVVDALSAFLEATSYLEIPVGEVSELLQQATDHLHELYCTAEDNYLELKQSRLRLEQEQLNRAALESLQAIIATFSHYLNNAAATISGRTQLLELALKQGEVDDSTGVVTKSIEVYHKSADQIVDVISKLKKLTVVETSIYHANTKIIDLANAWRKPETADADVTTGSAG
jgi:putative nucleotidyltransferase with HDIG domain